MVATECGVALDCRVEEYGTREEWLQARRSVIGASDTAGVMYEGYFDQTPVTVWESKLREPPEVSASKRKRFNVAKRLEPGMRSIFQDETGNRCWSLGDFTLCRHKELDWLGASLDGLTEHPELGMAVVELKDVGVHNRKEWEAAEPPLKFTIQINHQMAVTGLKHGFLLGLIGREPVIKHVPRNERFVEAMLKHLETFWGFVQRRELPPIDASLATAQVLARLWPRDSGATVTLPAEAAQWDADLTKAKADKKDAEAREVAAANLLKAAIGEATYGDLPGGGRYSWKEQTTQHKAREAFESSFRVLRRGK
jgi:putative phage-type endonuclease